jgi:D-lactate dehydrogenase
MKVTAFSVRDYEKSFLLDAMKGKHELTIHSEKLNKETAQLAKGSEAVAIFTSDDAHEEVLKELAQLDVRYLALRSVGFDHVDLKTAKELGIKVANVPAYSPYAVAEHAVALLLAFNRKIVQGQTLIQQQDFRLDSLVGFDVHGKTVGVIGTGKIGMAFAKIMNGFGAKVIAYDPVQNLEAVVSGVHYVSFDYLLQHSDIISLHCPLNPSTKYLISRSQFNLMKKNCILINTSRGGLINTHDLIEALGNSTINGACLDVYENEKGIFFEDRRHIVLTDALFNKLRIQPNVLMTGHQAFLTNEALTGIAKTTVQNLDDWQQEQKCKNELNG